MVRALRGPEILGFGRVAQRESTPFTREGSQVQSLSRPPFQDENENWSFSVPNPKRLNRECGRQRRRASL
jgi:hypothetical protein